MSFAATFLLGFIQGATELLPVSSSAHVILAGKFLGFDPTTPEGVLLLLTLHSGTMCAVLIHYWKRWTNALRSYGLFSFVKSVILSIACTAVVGIFLKWLIEKIWLKSQVESLFGNTELIALSLMATGILIFISARAEKNQLEKKALDLKASAWIGSVQGLCLPFRGFSRSGATISVGLLSRLDKATSETFSFALAVVLTPPLILREIHHLGKAAPFDAASFASRGLLGFCVSFVSGFLALKWLSNWVERGRWGYFSYYCFAMSVLVFCLKFANLVH
jgi:undecaprenyl-diphosphatase